MLKIEDRYVFRIASMQQLTGARRAKVTVLTDWELWACARQQIALYGDDAATHAAMRCDALLTNGDQAGHHAWLAILDRVGQLSGVREGEVRH